MNFSALVGVYLSDCRDGGRRQLRPEGQQQQRADPV